VAESTKLLNIAQTSKMMGVHPDTLRRWEKQGVLKSVRIGTRKDRRYHIEDIYKLLESSDYTPQKEDNTVKQIITNSKLILLDVSDTLIRPFPSRGSIYSAVALKYGYKVDPSVVEQEFHRLYNDWEKEKLFSDESIEASKEVRMALYSKLNADVLLNSGVTESSSKELLKMGKEIFSEIMVQSDRWIINDSVVDFLCEMQKQNKELGIIDNWDKNLVEILKGLDIYKYFKYVISGGELGMRKPKKDVFLHALNLFNVPASETVYIGNRYIDDVIGPLSVGITPLLYDPQGVSNAKDVIRFSKFSELL
jgi:FMN phosphatase YigB (HAD superfamily)